MMAQERAYRLPIVALVTTLMFVFAYAATIAHASGDMPPRATLRPVDQRASGQLASRLKKAAIPENDLDVALDGKVRIRARGSISLTDGTKSRVLAVFFQNLGRSCFGVAVFNGSTPRSFLCSRAADSLAQKRLDRATVAIFAVPDARSRRVAVETQPGRWLRFSGPTASIGDRQGRRLWVVAVPTTRYARSIVFYDKLGRSVAGWGQVCLRKPALCR
jgi:hypothetical protein